MAKWINHPLAVKNHWWNGILKCNTGITPVFDNITFLWVDTSFTSCTNHTSDLLYPISICFLYMSVCVWIIVLVIKKPLMTIINCHMQYIRVYQTIYCWQWGLLSGTGSWTKRTRDFFITLISSLNTLYGLLHSTVNGILHALPLLGTSVTKSLTNPTI